MFVRLLPARLAASEHTRDYFTFAHSSAPLQPTYTITMARLNQSADSSHTTPAGDRTFNAATGSSPAISSPALRPLSLEASLESHGSDNLPPSPLHLGSGRSSLSPADWCTLIEIVCDVSSSSPPSTPSPLEQGEQLFPNTVRTESIVKGRAFEVKGYHFVGDEAAGTGYEDQDDSMELSECVEGATAGDTMTLLGEPASLSVSKSDRWLQDSVSTHDEKDRLRYRGRRSPTIKRLKLKRQEQKLNEPADVTEGDTVEDVINLPSKRAPPAGPMDLGHSDSDCRPVPEDIKQPNRMRASMDTVLESDRIEQEWTEDKEEPGAFIPPPALRASALKRGVPQGVTVNSETVFPYSVDLVEHVKAFDSSRDQRQRRGIVEAQQYETLTAMKQQLAHEASDADFEDDTTIYDVRETQHVEVSISRPLHTFLHHTHVDKPYKNSQVDPFVASSQTKEDSALSTANTPPTAAQAPDREPIQFATNQNVPETPFTEILSYFRQYKGAENSLPKRCRNTALPQEIAAAAEITIHMENQVKSPDHEAPWFLPPTTEHTSASLNGMILPGASKDTLSARHPVDEEGGSHQVPASMNAIPRETAGEGELAMKSAVNDTVKQLILHPQHPAFVNAIGMIPATVFWVTAAPIVRYTSMAVELLIDKLRDTYL